MPIAIERCGCLLDLSRMAGDGIQIRFDWTRLHVVHSDAPAPNLSRQPLSKHLYGSLRGRVGDKPGRHVSLADARTDHDNATAALHVLQRRLRRDEYAANVDVDHAIQFFQRSL